MPRWKTYHLTDTWGFGCTAEVRYEDVSNLSNKKVPVAVVFSLTLFTRMFEVAFYWGDQWEQWE